MSKNKDIEAVIALKIDGSSEIYYDGERLEDIDKFTLHAVDDQKYDIEIWQLAADDHCIYQGYLNSDNFEMAKICAQNNREADKKAASMSCSTCWRYVDCKNKYRVHPLFGFCENYIPQNNKKGDK